MKIATIVGARPQFIKASCLSREIQNEKNITEVIIHTGQHFSESMSNSFFDKLNIPEPKYNLDIHSLSHGAMTGRMIEKIEDVLIKEKPNVVVVYGDTNSTLAGALASIKLHIPIAHIEAGLRSYNMNMPEEINRILTDHISTVLFCPTESSKEILMKENIQKNGIVVGDIMYDAFLYESRKIINDKITPSNYFLLTIHREENTNDFQKLINLFSTLTESSKKYNCEIIFPVHPRVINLFKKNNFLDTDFDRIHFIDPQGYIEMLILEKNAKLILTDSGGLQKEAYWSNVPCITLREETEWIELQECGINIVTGLNEQKINDAIKYFLSNDVVFPEGLYGIGNTSKNILEILKFMFGCVS